MMITNGGIFEKGELIMAKKRGLTDSFMKHLKSGGFLNPLLSRVQQDTALDLEIRENYLNIYYRGGSLLKVNPVSRKPGTYLFSFNTNYASKAKRAALELPCDTVTTPGDLESWLEAISTLKDTMDLWFGKHPKDERALQQMVVWENNDSPWANGTDYFIIDIEYDNHQGARFDLVALEWKSSGAERKLSKAYKPRLVIIEMKAGDGALAGKAGLDDHIKDLRKFNSNKGRIDAFKKEMLDVFEQKRELGLIKGLKANTNPVKAFAKDIDIIFLLAGHDPASKKLTRILKTVSDEAIKLSTANFMGYALYQENIYPITKFVHRFGQQIG